MLEVLCANGHDISLGRNSQGLCKQCKSLKDKRYIAKDEGRRETRALRSKAWALENPDKFKDGQRKHHLKKFNLTPIDYDMLFERQHGLCLLCGKAETTRDRTGKIRKHLSVDHNHITGKVRGLLCHHCNTALGHVNEDISLLYKMIAYIEGDINATD